MAHVHRILNASDTELAVLFAINMQEIVDNPCFDADSVVLANSASEHVIHEGPADTITLRCVQTWIATYLRECPQDRAALENTLSALAEQDKNT